ncbi:MAG: hypothetical protein ACOCUH_00595 [Bacteriovoracia bacterium]
MAESNIIFFRCSKDLEIIEGIINKAQEEGASCEFLYNCAEFMQYVPMIPNAVVIFHVGSKDDLIQVLELLQKSKKLISNRYIKIAGFNFLPNPRIVEILEKQGVSEILDTNIALKTLAYKIKMWGKVLKKQQVVDSQPKAPTEEKTKKAFQDNKNSDTRNSSQVKAIEWTQGLELEEDCWLIKDKENDCKKIIKTMVVRMLGPSPHVGKWVQVIKGPHKGTWQFKVFKEDDDTFDFLFKEGKWHFQGNKPEFEWKMNKWIFAGEKIDLFFIPSKKQEIFYRFQWINNCFRIANNSTYALYKQELLIQSLDREIEIHKEDEQSDEDFSLKSINKDQNSKHMKGKGSAADKHGGNLEGKGARADTHGGNLEGKGKEADKYGGKLEGKQNSNFEKKDKKAQLPRDNVSKGTLEGKGSEALKHEGYLKGKMAEDQSSSSNNKKRRTTGEYSKSSDDFSIKPENLPEGELQGKGSRAEVYEGKLKGHITYTSKYGKKNLQKKRREPPLNHALDNSLKFDIEESDLSLESGKLQLHIFKETKSGQDPELVEKDIYFEELTEEELIIRTDQSVSLEEKVLHMYLSFDYAGENVSFKMKGRVIEAENVENESFKIIQLEELDKHMYEKFMNHFQRRQNQATNFIQMARGVCEHG